jgi:RNA polymerase sigma-70 factor (ECF subfamily)
VRSTVTRCRHALIPTGPATAAGIVPGGCAGLVRPAALDRLLTAVFAAQVGAEGRALPLPADAPDDRSGAAGGPGVEVPDEPDGETAVGISLVRRAQDGDAEAFGQLYDRYADQVYRYLAYRLPNRQLAEDLTSETFLRALRRIGSFTWQGRDVGAWFVTIARNLVADHYKSGRYRLELSVGDVMDVSEPGATPTEQGPEALALSGITHDVLLHAVKQLGAEQQECIALRFLQGLSVSETAEIMGKNDGAIKALQHRAVKSLGRLLPAGWER